MVTTGLSLVLLLVAPLGLASVITLTLLIGICTFVGGLVGDAALFWMLRSRPSNPNGAVLPGGRRLPPER